MTGYGRGVCIVRCRVFSDLCSLSLIGKYIVFTVSNLCKSLENGVSRLRDKL